MILGCFATLPATQLRIGTALRTRTTLKIGSLQLWQSHAAEQIRVPGVGAKGFKHWFPVEKYHRNTTFLVPE
jgi:hypothetical protein